MTSTPQPSGADLARQALLAAREAAAEQTGHARKDKPRRRTGPALRCDGREPLGLGSAISWMRTERGLAPRPPTAASSPGSTPSSPRAAPELAGRVLAVALDADTGRPDVVPDVPAVGTKLCWSAPKPIAAANQQVPEANVRALHVLAPAPMKTNPTAEAPCPCPAPGRRAGGAPHFVGRLPARDRGAQPGRPHVEGGPGHRKSGGAADRRDAGTVPLTALRSPTG
ncbi:hypothetical protein ACFYW1_04165 [Streptomyces sp. NPDC002669]|uniref:hypothetical protein n=1 Tax=Streptomyces sp. NPDC002669 TaxID=3364658 RepID=UPI0036912241